MNDGIKIPCTKYETYVDEINLTEIVKIFTSKLLNVTTKNEDPN